MKILELESFIVMQLLKTSAALEKNAPTFSWFQFNAINNLFAIIIMTTALLKLKDMYIQSISKNVCI